MQEALVITTIQSVLDIVEQLRTRTDASIEVESDFTKGLKAIFYRIPGVVFLQDEIAGITAEKVTNQVKTLLEGEPIRLVLLRESPSTWDAGDLSFDGVIDLSLPPDELVGIFLQHVHSAPDPDKEPPAGEHPLQADSQVIELNIDSSQPESEAGFDPFSGIFPAHYHNNWGTLLPEAGQEIANPVEPAAMAGNSAGPYDEFSFDPPGDIVSTIPLNNTGAPQSATNYSPPGVQGHTSATGTGAVAEVIPELKDIRLTDKESPHQLFASMSDEAPADNQFQHAGSDPSPASLENRLRLKGIQTHSSILKASAPEIVPTSEASGVAQVSSGSTGQSAVRRSAPQHPSAQAAAGKPAAQSGTAPQPRSRLPADGNINAGAAISDEYAGKTSLIHKTGYALLLLLLCLATFLLVRDWDDLAGVLFKGKEEISITRTPPTPAMEKLPAFIPTGIPDRAYAAAHPGWERYVAGGLEYLVYRENGRIRALQVIAGTEGTISGEFLRMCIRGSTGLDDGSNWIREQRADFQVEKGTLPNKGEVAIYRKMPEGEIRGFVITLHS
jgi:hypothetical protein